ncbi:hypothetical protein [Janthinobacterium sp.]|uniref:hypothetical protein n=1 Tax=Janthinobacterium sp. TaxID=1871054 RepID=UPI0025C3D357|nr:hypothetical protein [Janthinobacterium sp.]
MSTTESLSRFRWRRTQQEMAAIVADAAPAESPTQQEIIDKLDVDVVRQFQRMLDSERD